MTAEGGELTLLVLDGTVPLLGPDGLTMTAGAYRPTEVCDAGIAEKLGIPAAYLRRMRGSRPGLFDANVNGWLAGDDRSFFVRCLRGDDGQTGIARAWLSDGYKPIDHLDTLMAVFVRIAPLTIATAKAIVVYLRACRSHGRSESSAALWLGTHNRGPMTGSGVYRMVKRRAEQAGYRAAAPRMT